MSQKIIMLGAVTGSIPLVEITGSTTVNVSVTVEVTTGGISGVGEITVIRDDTKAEVLAATAVTSGVPIAMSSGFGNITVTWSIGPLSAGDTWIYSVLGSVASIPEAYERNRTGVYKKLVCDEEGNLLAVVAAPPVIPTPVTGVAVERAKQKKITLSTTAQQVSLDSWIKYSLTNRSSAIISSSTFQNEDGAAQVETNTIASAVLLGGNLDVIVTALGMTGTPKTITPAVLGILQQESIQCTAGESTGAGNITMTVTALGMSNSPKAVVVPIGLADGVNDVGLALRTALAADVDVAAFFDVSGATDTAILTSKIAVADDATMDLGFVDTDSTGVTFGASTDTTAGEKASTAAEIAEIVKDALNADGDIGAWITATRSGNDVIMTADAIAANDVTMNLSVATGTATGLTASPTSVDTTAGLATGDWDETGGQGTLPVVPPPMTINSVPFTFIWLKASTGTPSVILRGWKEV